MNMKRFTYTLILAVLCVVGAALGALLTPSDAHAAPTPQVEPSLTPVKVLRVTYVEDIPNERFPRRAYFETNDDAAYRYVTYRACASDDLVPNRICRTVFWYAR